jgi:ankyrin repeat protein
LSSPAPAPSPYRLWEAIENGQLETFQCLYGESVDPQQDLYATDLRGRNTLYKASRNGRTKIVDALVSYMSSDALKIQDAEGRTALHLAVMNAYSDITKRLLEGCAPCAGIEIKDKEGKTALHFAAYYGLRTIAETLIKSGANVKSKDSDRHTPKELAKWKHHYNTVKTIESWEHRREKRRTRHFN